VNVLVHDTVEPTFPGVPDHSPLAPVKYCYSCAIDRLPDRGYIAARPEDRKWGFNPDTIRHGTKSLNIAIGVYGALRSR
jgi:hypothetical protein